MTTDEKSIKIVQKSEMSYKAFLCLQDHEHLSPSIHCCYYSCFQLVLAFLIKFKPEKYEEYKNEKASHTKQIKLFLDAYFGVDFENATRVKDQLFELKELRNEADYSELQITKEMVKSSGERLTDIRKKIQNDFSSLFE